MAFLGNKKLDLILMRGEKGDKGDKGEKGDKGDGFEKQFLPFEPKNIIEGMTLTESVGKCWDDSCKVVETQYTAMHTAINELIEVLPNHRYRIPRFVGNLMLYSEDGNTYEQLACSVYPIADFEFTVPAGLCKMGINYKHADIDGVSEVYRLTQLDEEKEYFYTCDKFHLRPENIVDEDTKEFIVSLKAEEEIKFERDESVFVPQNILDGMTLTESVGKCWDDSCKVVETQYTAMHTAINELIEVLPNHRYRIPRFVGNLMLYSEDGNTYEQLACSVYPIADFEFTVPAGLCKMGINYKHADIDGVSEVYRLTMTEDERQKLPFKSDELTLYENNIKTPAIKSLLCPLKDKTIVNFGDSIFGNARPPEDISTYLSKLTGATVHNCGFGGCRMSYHPSSNYDAFSMTKLADAIANGDFSLQEAAVSNTNGDAVPSYFAETLTLLKGLDFAKVDIITIAYGSNDLNGIAIDDGTKDSYAGALRYSIETILNAYPHIKIFICSQAYRFWMDESGAFVEDTDTKVGGMGYTTLELVEKTEEVAKEYKLPFIDNYHSLGINRFNRVRYFPNNDGAHHNLSGRELIARHIAKELF